jgi:hypothetical protein
VLSIKLPCLISRTVLRNIDSTEFKPQRVALLITYTNSKLIATCQTETRVKEHVHRVVNDITFQKYRLYSIRTSKSIFDTDTDAEPNKYRHRYRYFHFR